MKVWLDPSKCFSWIILWIWSLTYYLICRGVNFTLVLREFLWSIMDDLKSDSMLLGMLEVPKQGYQHVSNWNTLGGMAVHSEMVHCNLSPRWPEKGCCLHLIPPFFLTLWSAEKVVCCQLNNLQQTFLKKIFFANSCFFSLSKDNIFLHKQLCLKSHAINQRYPFLYAIR